ncbi:hypothetical protein [Streptomyces naganishii]|uniref:Regulatory protein n=1 Tax=Streptomyces naganishii JCM 4654 TaxID=1306179 RepID=A0A918Y129_9ACTN|nr:hypothetical protein [Streptomyces naganishii]GHD87438.1 hypothetical protein GCM10010508_19570 [Streptomyces naganishii JCM 4654]
MSENTNTTPSSELTSQYIAQVTGDLEANVKEQERIGVEIAALQEQLTSLRRDHALLVSMQQALGIATPSTAPATTAPPAPALPESAPAPVPAPRGKASAKKSAAAPKAVRATKRAASGGTATAKPAEPAADAVTKLTGKSTGRSADKNTGKSADKTTATSTARTAAKPTTKAPAKTTAKTAAKTTAKTTAKAGKAAGAGGSRAGQPTLVELVRAHLSAQTEPRSAAEVTTALGQAHPDRRIQNTVVRTTLEGLVARNQAQRSKQGTSVFYTVAGGGQAAAQPAPSDAAGSPASTPAGATAATEETAG